VLRHQLNVLRRRLHGRVRLTNHDRWFLIRLYRWFPSIPQVLTIMRPETLVRWHRAGFRCYWRWKSRPLGGRPQIDTELRALIRRMSMENPLWGAPRIHGRLLQLHQNASILEQGCAGFSPGSAKRCDQFTRHPGRTSSPLRPRLSFWYTQVDWSDQRCRPVSPLIWSSARFAASAPGKSSRQAGREAGHLTSTEIPKRTVQRSP
jgi:hypothetical protein